MVVLLMTLLLTWLSVTEGLGTPYWGIAYPVLATYGAALLAVLWHRQLPLRTVEALVLGPMIIVLLGFLAAWRLAPAAIATEAADLFLVMLWAGLAFPLCFLLFGTWRGLQASLGIYGVFLLLVLPPAVRGAIPSPAAGSMSRSTISLAVFFAVLIALLWVLASRLEELASARAEARLFATLAVTDTLTGLANRRQLDDELDRQIATARRHPQPLSIALIDLDRFKAVNDRLGHQAGDHVLIEIAQRLTGSVRTSDILGRWGGEEFLLISPHTDLDAALVLAERCRVRVADATFLETVHITASFGVATLAPEDDARSLIRRADHALYRAKDQDRDRVVGAAEGPGPITVPGPG
jgi:diguanylate cyclase (GGDEF)-like protein